MLVFISWSGPRSKAVAEALENWLAQVIQAVEPWISQDIDKGSRWGAEITDRLERSKVGIICLTKSNLDNKWVHFEAGALSKNKDPSVCTLLLDIKFTEVEYPLAQFQHTTTEKEQVFKLLKTINLAVEESGEKALTEAVLRKVFETYWPDLEKAFKETTALQETTPSPSRSTDEVLQEVLEILRNQERRQNRLSQNDPPRIAPAWPIIESAVYSWLQRNFPERASKAALDSSIDFVMERPEGILVGVVVKSYTRPPSGAGADWLVSSVLTLQNNINKGIYIKGLVVLVAANSVTLGRLNNLIDELDAPDVAFAIGFINDSGEFEAVRSTPFDF